MAGPVASMFRVERAVSQSANPPALGSFLSAAPQTFADLEAKITASRHPEPLKSQGAWAARVLAGTLGDDWPGKFQQRSGHPYLTFALAPFLPKQATTLVELAAQLHLLQGTSGLPTILRQIQTDLQPGVMNSARLQFEVAALEKRRNATVMLEVDRGPGNWKPDVMLSNGQESFGVECLYLSVGEDVLDQFRTSAPDDTELDGWKRIGAKLATKAGQPAQDGGWLRCHLDDGMFANEPFMRSALMADPLERKGEQLAQGALEQMAISGDIHGVVFSGLPNISDAQADETCRLTNGSILLRRRLAGERFREIFIIPNVRTMSSEIDAWFELYDQEPSWLPWALEQAAQ